MIEMKWEFPDWYGEVVKNTQRINMAIAASMQTNRALMFDAEGAHNGHDPWAPLKMRDGMILSDRGVLRRSIGPMTDGRNPAKNEGSIVDVQGDMITIGTRIGYARLMNDGTTKMPGGVLKAVNAKALKIPVHGAIKKGVADTKARLEQMSSDEEDTQEFEDLNEKLLDLKQQKEDAYSNADFKRYMTSMRKLANHHLKHSPAKGRRMHKVLNEMAKRNLGGKTKSQLGNERFIFRRSVKIPARDFETWNDTDQIELQTVMANLIVEILNGKN